MPLFDRYIGIDYSGATVPDMGQKGIRVYLADHDSPPREESPPPGRSKYWSRRGLAIWLEERLHEADTTIVGLDHAFSFPLRYFDRYGLERDWPAFLADFHRHWPTDEENTYVDFVRDGVCGLGALRVGDSRWRRLTEERAGGAKSVFHFDVPGSVAKSTHAGLPFLLQIRRALGAKLHFWPFDGWLVPQSVSAIAEVYPSLWSGAYPREGRTPDQHDAYSIAAWLRETDLDRRLGAFLDPTLAPPEAAVAAIEGWILGVR